MSWPTPRRPARSPGAHLAGFAASGRQFDTVFAVNVNVFWVGPADAEWRAISRLLRRTGVLHLFYETPGQAQARRVADTVTAALTGRGFSITVTAGGSPRLIRITGRSDHHPR